jgi:hypothetical protein
MSRNSNHALLNFTILQESDISTISASSQSKKSIFAQIFNFFPG